MYLTHRLIDYYIELAKKFIQLVNTLFNEVIDEYENFVFYFNLKLNELFDQHYTRNWHMVSALKVCAVLVK